MIRYALFVCLVGLGFQCDSFAKPPDIVIFISDDQSRDDCTAYSERGIATPNMHKLAQSGMTFQRAYVVSPSCAPSRATLLTGLNPARNGAEANHRRPKAELKKWPAYFQEHGYEVVAFGKVSHYKHTIDYGFDSFAHDTFHDHAGIPAAIEYLKNRDRGSPKPLCMFVGSNWPHVPWPTETADIDPKQLTLPPGSIDTPATRQWRARFAAAVAKGDRELGDVRAAVEEYLPKETLFAYTADHGSQWPFGKWNLYEAGVAVPLIVSWPGKIAAGTRTEAMVNWTDLLPTMLEAAGVQAPLGIDGKSFVPVLMGQVTQHRDLIFTTHSNDNRMNVYPARAVRDGRFKYIRNLHPEYAFTTHIDLVGGELGQRAFFSTWEEAAKTDPGAAAILHRYHARPAEELYDLEKDPDEQHNVATQPEHRAKLAELRTALDSWIAAQGDQLKIEVKPRLLSDPESLKEVPK